MHWAGNTNYIWTLTNDAYAVYINEDNGATTGADLGGVAVMSGITTLRDLDGGKSLCLRHQFQSVADNRNPGRPLNYQRLSLGDEQRGLDLNQRQRLEERRPTFFLEQRSHHPHRNSKNLQPRD